jgi:hypothetical protein
VRVIPTPPLEPGRTHYYTLRIEGLRDGQRDVRTREVSFQAGQDVTVDWAGSTEGNVVKR